MSTIETPPRKPVQLDFCPAPGFRSALHDEENLADARGKRIGILIVTYNAVSTILGVLQRITPEVWKNVEEVAIFDDASPDPTCEFALGLRALMAIPKLTVIKHPNNLGYGGNQKAGYEYFANNGFDIVVLLHGDGQYAPEILSHLYHPLVAGQADAVFGSRMMKEFGGALNGGMPLYKYVGNRILTIFENRALGLDLTEFHSGYRAYNLHALKRVDLTYMTNDFHFDTEIIIKLHHQGFRITEVPIPTYYGQEICYVNGVKYAKDVARAVRRYILTRRSIAKYPEFQEYYVQYPIKHSSHSNHHYARAFVGRNEDVLEVGCGQGELAGEFIGRGNRVSGVGTIPADAVAAPLQKYVQADLDAGGIARAAHAFEPRSFDKILLLDVLEHAPDPRSILRECRRLLRPGGAAIVSVPNVANISVRLMLALGRFEYTDRGILDRTHLRFFTRKSIRRIVEEEGYTVTRRSMTVIPLERILGLGLRNPLMRLLHWGLIAVTAILPGLLGYQTVLIVTPKE